MYVKTKAQVLLMANVNALLNALYSFVQVQLCYGNDHLYMIKLLE